ncbi:hypothetical protein MUB18_04065 [Sphingobacterium sp. PCS056]|uniref:galactosyltransferase-related protein n=1 Tax=Sphingobacterium sp. PCS056 TaxID=2931400 RepID=UPI00200E1622|nr:galactosyltransferase-related protein [Sphingobacterium sp. PCS056]UPZ37487.1 hypothetical protein MUB18_04065 [Sphingobacterium sp. PCS056]
MGRSLIYLTAQPDEKYFIWQLKIQLYNFNELGIGKKYIQVLIGVKNGSKLKKSTSEFCELYKNFANFYFYHYSVDPRITYTSNIRPQILFQHFKEHTYLENAAIFYCDSDVILRKVIPKVLATDDKIYVSNTSNYLDSKYFINKTSVEFFSYISSILDIDSQNIINNDKNCGGAQYILKNIKADFWLSIEKDSQIIFSELNNYNNLEAYKRGCMPSEYSGIQSWCADMWSVFWNLLKLDYKVSISKEMDFCWANDNESRYNQTRILHYTGSQNDEYIFKKSKFLKYEPFYNLFIDKSNLSFCSKIIVDYIDKVRIDLLERNRIDLTNTSFLIPIRIDSQSRLDNLIATVTYLSKFFNTEIIIIENDSIQKIPKELIEKHNICYEFENNSGIFNRAKINNKLIKKSLREIIALYDADVIFPVHQIVEAINMITEEDYDCSFPFDGRFLDIDPLHKRIFSKVLDPALFFYNEHFFKLAGERSVGGAIFLKRLEYIKAGSDNLRISTWGPDDKERVKRLQILDLKIGRVKGCLYHLPHERLNSNYINRDLEISYRKEYLKISSMSKQELLNYIGYDAAFNLN